MHFDCENTWVFKDFDFLTVVVVADHLLMRSLQKSFQNQYPRRDMTLPNPCFKSLASWKRFCDAFGTILDSKRSSQRGPLRVPGASKDVFLQAWAPR